MTCYVCGVLSFQLFHSNFVSFPMLVLKPPSVFHELLVTAVLSKSRSHSLWPDRGCRQPGSNPSDRIVFREFVNLLLMVPDFSTVDGRRREKRRVSSLRRVEPAREFIE